MGLSKLLEPLTGRRPEVPDLPGIDPQQVQAATIAANRQALPDIEAIGKSVNEFNSREQLAILSKALEFMAPGALGKAQGIVSSQLRGEVPADVAAQVQRAAAARGLAGGYGAGSGLGQNLSLRDFGLTSMGVQQQGLGNFMQLSSLAPRTPTFDPLSMFYSPQQRLAFAVTERDTQFNRNWLSEQVAAAPSPLGQFVQNVVYAVAGTAGRWLGTAGGGGMSGGAGGGYGGVGPGGGGGSGSSGGYVSYSPSGFKSDL